MNVFWWVLLLVCLAWWARLGWVWSDFLDAPLETLTWRRVFFAGPLVWLCVGVGSLLGALDYYVGRLDAKLGGPGR